MYFLRCLRIYSFAALIGLAAGCERNYDQSTPETTLYSLQAMAANGEVGRIHELIHADDPNLELALLRVGDLLQRMYDLSLTVRGQFPEEVEGLLTEGEAKAGEFVEEQDRRRGDNEFGRRFQRFLVDPIGLLADEYGKLETVSIADDMAAVTYDGQPLFGVGVIMELHEDGNWYFTWPSMIPGLNRGMPQTEAEWRIIQSMLKSINNGLLWAEEEIASGEVKSIERAWREVAEKTLPQVVAQWMIYQRALEMRPKAEDATPQAEDGEASDPVPGPNAGDG